MFDATVPHGWHYSWKSCGLRSLEDPVIDAMVEGAMGARSPRSYAVLFHLGGAVADAAPDATAYARRDVAHELNVNAVWLPHEEVGDAETAWARGFVDALAPYAAGAYVNFLDRDDGDRLPEAFGPSTYERLTALRRRFDPDGVFEGRWGAVPTVPGRASPPRSS